MKLGTKEITGKFTIPSGIITTNISILEKIANELLEIGILTTKSIGPKPRDGNREPIYAQYAPGSFTNAVGLTNPGAEEFARQLKNLKIPKDKFLLTSIFGANLEEFVYVAETLAPFSDGLELNFSCPHAKGYGQVIGQDKELVSKIISVITTKTNIPIFVKLSPNIPNLGEIAKACIDSGAYGITAINTAGPGYHMVDGHPVLTNKLGGLSGKAILPIGLKCIKEISEAISSLEKETKIIACGGITSAQDIKNYEAAGADFFGIGSALTGMDTQELKLYFSELSKDLQQNTDNAVKHLKSDNSMGFVKYKIKKKTNLADDLTLLEFNDSIEAHSGQFIFLWLPSVGEKPFSVLDNNPLTILVQQKGCFTKALSNLKENETAYVRGPYGKRTKPLQPENDLVLVGGGTGIAALYLIARENKNKKVYIFLGARDKTHLAYVDRFEQLGNLLISTEDGSLGFKGNVVELLQQQLEKGEIKNPVFYNCGPKGMIKALTALEEQHSNKEQIYSSIDYTTKCGVGICGSCATEDGRRSCVDGTFLIKQTWRKIKMEQKHVVDRLYEKMDEKQTPLMIGLDPNLAMFPEHILKAVTLQFGKSFEAAAEAIRRFNFSIIDATHDLVPIYKPQSAYYEQYGNEGIKALRDTVRYAKSKGAMVCLDAKRNDIGPTSTAYAEAILGEVLLPDGSKIRSAFDIDLLTVNGYLGSDGVNPFIEVCNRDNKGIFVLAKTSNPSAGELQDKTINEGNKVYIEMAKLIKGWGTKIGESGYSNMGAVVGATYPEEAEELRKMLPQTLFLMPGYGAQGGKAQTLVNGFDENGRGAVVNSSRGITYAFSNDKFKEKHPELAEPEKFAEAARQATIDAITEINNALKEAEKLPKGWNT